MIFIGRRAFSAHRSRGLWWFRIYGYGLFWKDNRRHPPLFSERNGYRKFVKVGPWRFRILR